MRDKRLSAVVIKGDTTHDHGICGILTYALLASGDVHLSCVRLLCSHARASTLIGCVLQVQGHSAESCRPGHVP